MIRSIIVATVLVAGLGTVPKVAASAAQAGAQVTAADAAPFVGDWTLAMQGQNGPATFELSVKVEKDKVVAEIKGGEMPVQPITDVSKTEKSLVLRYSFDYQGNAVPTAVSLIPADGGKTTAEIDFAGGAYVMTGTATKKESAK